MADDKSYSAELRLNQLWNHLGPIAAGGGTGQRLTVYTTADVTISSTTDVTISGGSPLSLTVVAGAYRIAGKITWTQNFTNITQAIGFTGPSTSHVRIPYQYFKAGAGPSSDANATGIMGTLSGGVGTSPFSTPQQNYLEFDGMVVFTAGGTLAVVAHCNTTNTFVVNSYSFMDVESVGQTS